MIQVISVWCRKYSSYKHVLRPQIDSYSVFFDNGGLNSTGLEKTLKAAGIDTVFVTGLALDYCVNYTSVDAVNLGGCSQISSDGMLHIDTTDQTLILHHDHWSDLSDLSGLPNLFDL